MKRIHSFVLIPVIAILFAACNGAETKADAPSGHDKNEMTGAERVPDEKIPENKTAPSALPDSSSRITAGNEIIAKIDQYLVSTGNLAGATVTVNNILPNITFQKAIVEVTFLDADGKMIRSEYFTIQNIEPGDTETIKLSNMSKAASLVTHIVKIKSNALTNGEMVLSGTHFEEGK